MKKFFLVMAASFLVLFFGCQKNDEMMKAGDENVSLKSAKTADGYNVVPNELIIKFKANTPEDAKGKVMEKFSAKLKEKIQTKSMEKHGDKEGITLVSMPGSVDDALAKVKGLPEVEYAEPNYIYDHYATSNDTYYTNGSLWGMYSDITTTKNVFGSHAGDAWAFGHTGTNTVWIGIIDEGYMYTHEDLAANAGMNPGEIPGNGIDDDNNGYKDDVYGWDFDGNNNTVFDGLADDHGTHVAGTIGAVGGNGKGVAGVCWNVKLMDAKFLGTKGGTTTNAIKAVDYFTVLKSKGVNIVATNNSWGGGGFSQGLQDAIERANAANILFIAAAGNSGTDNDLTPSYPASYPNANIIAVAAITSTGGLATFSQYGATSVDLGAPGSGIYSTVPVKVGKGVGPGYVSYSGTSMATPHVTGAAALYASTHPGASAATIKAAITSSVAATPALAGKCLTGGRLDVSGF